MAKAKKERRARRRTTAKAKKGPPVICGCPSGTRARVRAGTIACETPSGETRSASCSIGTRTYAVGPPRTRTDERSGRSQGLVLEDPRLRYSTMSAPCGSKRKGCPVQLIARGGKQYLRFCIAAGNKQPGHMVAVPNPSAARRIATEACAQWESDGRKFTASNPAVRAANGALGRLSRR